MLEIMKLRTRILLAYCIPLALFAAVTLLVFANVRLADRSSDATERSHDIVEYAMETETAVSMVQRGTRGYLLVRESKHSAALQEGIRRFAAAVEALDRLVTDPGQRALLARMKESQNRLNETDLQLAGLVDQGRTEEAIAEFRTGLTARLYDEFRVPFAEFRQREIESLKAQRQARQTAMQHLMTVVWSGTALATVASVVIGFWLAARISRSIRESVSALTSSSSEIAATMNQHERTMSQQAVAVNQTTSTAEELSASARTSTEQSEATAALANRSLSLTEDGIRLASRVYDGLTGMKQKVADVAEQILRLSAQADQIGSIAKVVAELAGETNMLALNAAVEAARAGEHGKGFAVVASEIRKLADQSKKSAERANTLVAEIQKVTNSAVMVTEEGTRTAEEVAAVSQQAGDAFAALSDAAKKVYESAQQVMLNSRQQSGALIQIADAMKTLSLGAREMAQGTVQTRLGVDRLNEVAQMLKSMV